MSILKDLVKHYEGLHDGDLTQIGLQPKMCPAGVWTEGWGHAMLVNGQFLKGVASKKQAYALAKVKTLEDAERMLEQDLQPFRLMVARKIKVPLTEAQEAALVSHFYNTGGSSTLCNLVNTKSGKLYDWWCDHYIMGGGQVLKGLIARRKTEAHLFMTGQLKFFN